MGKVKWCVWMLLVCVQAGWSGVTVTSSIPKDYVVVDVDGKESLSLSTTVLSFTYNALTTEVTIMNNSVQEWRGQASDLTVNGVQATPDNVTSLLFGLVGSGGGSGPSPGTEVAWGDVLDKPFVTLGDGVTVSGMSLTVSGDVARRGANNTFTGSNTFNGDGIIGVGKKLSYGTTGSAYPSPADNNEYITKGWADATYTGGGGSTTWSEVEGKPFSTIGQGLAVWDDVLMATWQDDVTWQDVTDKPFSTIGTGLAVWGDALVATGGGGGSYTAGDGIDISDANVISVKPDTYLPWVVSDANKELYVGLSNANFNFLSTGSVLGQQLTTAVKSSTTSGQSSGEVRMSIKGTAGEAGFVAQYPWTAVMGVHNDQTEEGADVTVTKDGVTINRASGGPAASVLRAEVPNTDPQSQEYITKYYADQTYSTTSTWGELSGKPFNTIGSGLSVVNNALTATGGGATTWGQVSGKPFTAIGTNLSVTNDVLNAKGDVTTQQLKDTSTAIRTWANSTFKPAGYAPAWGDVTGKPFKTIGTNLSVTNDVLNAKGDVTTQQLKDTSTAIRTWANSTFKPAGYAPAWGDVTGKPFSTIGDGLLVENDVIAPGGYLWSSGDYDTVQVSQDMIYEISFAGTYGKWFAEFDIVPHYTNFRNNRYRYCERYRISGHSSGADWCNIEEVTYLGGSPCSDGLRLIGVREQAYGNLYLRFYSRQSLDMQGCEIAVRSYGGLTLRKGKPVMVASYNESPDAPLNDIAYMKKAPGVEGRFTVYGVQYGTGHRYQLLGWHIPVRSTYDKYPRYFELDLFHTAWDVESRRPNSYKYIHGFGVNKSNLLSTLVLDSVAGYGIDSIVALQNGDTVFFYAEYVSPSNKNAMYALVDNFREVGWPVKGAFLGNPFQVNTNFYNEPITTNERPWRYDACTWISTAVPQYSGGGGDDTPTWADVTGKPFSTIGDGLAVTDGVLSATGGGGGSTAWGNITGKPFNSVGSTGLSVTNNIVDINSNVVRRGDNGSQLTVSSVNGSQFSSLSLNGNTSATMGIMSSDLIQGLNIVSGKSTLGNTPGTNIAVTEGSIAVNAPVTSSSTSTPTAKEFITKEYADATYTGGGGGTYTAGTGINIANNVISVKDNTYLGYTTSTTSPISIAQTIAPNTKSITMYNDNMVLNATNSNNNHKSLIQITPEKLTISCLDNSDASMVFDDGHIGVDVPLTSSSSTASNPGQSEFITKAYADATYSGGGGGGVTYAEMVRYVDSVMLVSKQPIYVGFPSAVMLSLHDSGNLAIHNCSFDDQQGWTIDAGKVMFSDRDFTNSFCDCACVTLHDGDAYLLAYIFDRKTLARDIVLINCTTKKIEGCWDGYPMFQITQPVSLDNTLVFYTYGGNSGGTGGGLVVRHTFDTVTKEHTRMVYETGDGSIVNFMQTYDGYLFLNIVNTENTQYDGFYRVSVSDFTSNERIRKSLSITYQDAVTPLPEPTNSHIIKTKDLSYVLWEMSLESPQPTINWTLVSDILPGTTCTEYQHDKLSNDGNTAILGGDLDQRGFVFAYNIGSSNVNFYVTERTNAITQKTAINHYNINVIPYVVRGFETTWWENSPAAYLDYSLWGIGFSFWRRMSNLMLTLFSKGGTILWPPLSIEEIVQGSN